MNDAEIQIVRMLVFCQLEDRAHQDRLARVICYQNPRSETKIKVNCVFVTTDNELCAIMKEDPNFDGIFAVEPVTPEEALDRFNEFSTVKRGGIVTAIL